LLIAVLGIKVVAVIFVSFWDGGWGLGVRGWGDGEMGRWGDGEKKADS
jgi:hypothetical protein